MHWKVPRTWAWGLRIDAIAQWLFSSTHIYDIWVVCIVWPWEFCVTHVVRSNAFVWIPAWNIARLPKDECHGIPKGVMVLVLLWWKFALLVKVQNIMFSSRFVLSNLRWALSLSPLQACGGLTGNNLVAKLWMGYIPHEPHLTYMGPRDSPTQVLVRKVFAWAFRIRTSWSHGFQKTIWNKYEIVPCWGPLAPHRKTESSLDELIDSSPISTVGQFGWLNFFQW
jgi:hypothetical protein